MQNQNNLRPHDERLEKKMHGELHDNLRKAPNQDSGEEHPAEEEKSMFFSLPQELMETIFARMPYPSVLKAGLLSKPWNRKFCSPWGESLRKSFTPFQKEVSSMSHKWPVYAPVYVTTEGFWGFDRPSSKWKSLFLNVCNRNTILADPMLKFYGYIECVGSLLLVSTLESTKSGLQTTMYVTNVITGSWTKLYLAQLTESQVIVRASLLPGDSNSSFRVLQICKVWDENSWSSQLQTSLYDSKVGGWSVTITKGVSLHRHFKQVGWAFVRRFYNNNVYLHGKLYCLWMTDFLCSGSLCVYHVDSDKTWTVSISSFPYAVHFGDLLLCGGKVILATTNTDCVIFIYELNLEELGSKQLLTTARIMPNTATLEDLTATSVIRFSSDDDFIYVIEYFSRRPMMTYNVHSGEWGTLPPHCHEKHSGMQEENITLLHSAFRPGLDPFAIVQQ